MGKGIKWPPKIGLLAFFLIILVSIWLPGPVLGATENYASEVAPPIRLQAAPAFRPAKGEAPDIPPGLMAREYAQEQRGYYIVQFQGPVQEAWKKPVEATGAELLGYIPEFAFKVRMNPGQAKKVAQLPNVIWVGLFHPAYKLSPNLKTDEEQLFSVRLEKGADAAAAQAAIAASGAEIVSHKQGFFIVAAEKSQLEAIARILDVARIESFKFPEKHNEFGGGQIMGASLANSSGYDGSTQTVAVCDTGLGTGVAASAHEDIPASRITAMYNWDGASTTGLYSIIDDGPRDVDSGHGTHVALSVLGDGDSDGKGKGVAPGAALVFQAVENWVDWGWLAEFLYGLKDGYFLIGIPAPPELGTLFQQAYNAGARVHSNSWGISGSGGIADENTISCDDYIWNNPDFTILFSAGNEGPGSPTVAPPSTAKNVISVGASENDREDDYACDFNKYGISNNIILTYGAAWPDTFTEEPLKSDPMAGNAEQMAGFSGRGPCADTRIKPDVVAPGTYNLSGYSDLFQIYYDSSPNPQNNAWQYDGWGNPLNAMYKYMGGTSMSCPLTAGAAAVVRDFYQKVHGHNASAALVKASLINSAVDLLDENNDGEDDNYYPIPNIHEGWGRVDVARATDNNQQFVEDTGGVATGGTKTYNYTVPAGAAFKVTLVWTDRAQDEYVNWELINDLDLVVISPGGTYRGNVFSGGWSVTGGTADRRNNVECVYIQSAPAGTYQVEVKGYNVPEGRTPGGTQPFALVVRSEEGQGPPPPPLNQAPVVTITSPANGATFTEAELISFAGTATDHEDGNISGSLVWTSSVDGQIGTGASFQRFLSVGPHTITARVTDSGGKIGEAVVNITINQAAPGTMHIGDLDGSTSLVYIRGRLKGWSANVTINVHNQNHAGVFQAVVTGTWSGGYSGTSSATTNNDGTCIVSTGTISMKKTSVTFTVSNVSKTSYTYALTSNHDSDGGSDGTRITVAKPLTSSKSR